GEVPEAVAVPSGAVVTDGLSEGLGSATKGASRREAEGQSRASRASRCKVVRRRRTGRGFLVFLGVAVHHRNIAVPRWLVPIGAPGAGLRRSVLQTNGEGLAGRGRLGLLLAPPRRGAPE